MVNDPVVTSRILEAFRTTARPIMRKFMSANSCIAAAKTTILTLDLFKIPSWSRPVAYAFEVPEANYARVGGFCAEERERMRQTARFWKRDGDGNGWDGHLLVIVENRWLVDSAIDQMGSQEFGVEVPSEALIIDSEQRLRSPFEIKMGLILDNGHQAKLMYRSNGDRSYRKTEAWTDEGLPFLAQQIAMRMVAKLADDSNVRLAR